MSHKESICPRCGSALRVYRTSCECSNMICGLGVNLMDDEGSLYYWRQEALFGANTLCPRGCLMIFKWERP